MATSTYSYVCSLADRALAALAVASWEYPEAEFIAAKDEAEGEEEDVEELVLEEQMRSNSIPSLMESIGKSSDQENWSLQKNTVF